MTIRRWMIIVAVFAISMAIGEVLYDPDSIKIPHGVVVGLLCVMASLPMIVIAIDLIRTFRPPD